MIDEPKDPPIEEMEYAAGVNVVDFGELRIARGLSKRPPRICAHKRMQYDINERRIWCPECEQNIDPFDAFSMLVEQYDTVWKRATKRIETAEEAQRFSLISRAAKHFDKEWRSRNMAPLCPHCKTGILPEDALNMGDAVGIEFERERRKRSKPTH